MKKLIFLLFVFIIFSFCGPKKEEIEKYLIKQRTIPEDEASEFLALDLLIICGQDFEKESELDIEKIPSISRITRFRPMFSVFYSLSDSQFNIYSPMTWDDFLS